jgi:chromosomal replication initiation ATPase DnaA
MTDFPDAGLGALAPVHLYASASDISIYSSHIHSLVECCARSVFGISAAAFRSRDRAGSIALARQTAMYLSHVAFGLTFTETGRLFDRDRTTVSHACAIVEDLRDDPAMDRALSILEAALTRPRPEGA